MGECTFNCAAPGILLLCLRIGTGLRQCCRPFFFALLAPVSPLCAVGLLPWLAFSLCRYLATRKDSLAVTIGAALCALPLVICMALYYMSGDGSSARFLRNDSSYYSPVDQRLAGRLVRYASILLALLVPAFMFLYKRYKRTMLFWSTVYLAVLTPIVWIGEEHNELIFKCSVIIYFSLALLYASLFIHTRHRVAKLALASYILLESIGSLGDIGLRVLAHYSWDNAEMKENTWDRRLADMRKRGIRFYRRFHGEKPISSVLYSQPGKAARGPLRFMSVKSASREDLPCDIPPLRENANGQNDVDNNNIHSVSSSRQLAK